MIARFLFVLKEGLSGLVRAKASGFAALITVTISLILIGIFLTATVNLERLIAELRSRVELEIFLDDSLDEGMTKTLAQAIHQIEGVAQVEFVSKDEAVAEFKKIFDTKEEDYFATLDHNPLPASFRIRLTESFRSSTGADAVLERLKALEEVNDNDIVYRSEYLSVLEKYIGVAVVIDLAIGTILCISALFLVSNNVKLIILSKRRIIETMRLVGATDYLVRMPLFVQGFVQGLIAGVLAALFLYGLISLLAIQIPGYIQVSWKIYLVLLNLGLTLGLAGSFLSIRKYL